MARKKKDVRRPWQKPKGLLDRLEAEERLGLGKHWISRRTHAANAPAVTWYGSRPLYKEEDLDRFIEERNRTGQDPAHNAHSVDRKPHGGGRKATKPKKPPRPLIAATPETLAAAAALTGKFDPPLPLAEVAELLREILMELRLIRRAVTNETGPTYTNAKSDESDLPGFGR